MAHSSFENHHARLSIISVISDLKKNAKILILTKQLYEKNRKEPRYHASIMGRSVGLYLNIKGPL